MMRFLNAFIMKFTVNGTAPKLVKRYAMQTADSISQAVE